MSAELVEQIAHFIKLTPLETYQLKEAWKMAWLKRVHAMSDEIVKLKLDFNASN